MSGMWKILSEFMLETALFKEHFWSGIGVFVERPHLLNTKILAAERKKLWVGVNIDAELINLLTHEDYLCENINSYLMQSNFNFSNLGRSENIKQTWEEITSQNENACVLIVRSLVAKFSKLSDVLEAVLLDFSEQSATFFPRIKDLSTSLIAPSFPYKIQLTDERILLLVWDKFKSEASPAEMESRSWLENKVFPKICKWCLNVPKMPIVPSLNLISIKEYKLNLHRLKNIYAKPFLDIWPQYCNMDPTRYVHQSIALAAYLITLWNEEKVQLNLSKKQTFVDLGCGNGFLTYILSSEGHTGVGVDLRKRKLWEVYGPNTNLIEMVIQPSDKQLFPDHDWIIGNHSDELTPWIPLIAARSSYRMRMFLLPCCFFTFNGKYERSYQNATRYQSYLQFLQQLCTTVGLEVQMDRLRITSTKRTCLVSLSRNYESSEECSIDLKRLEYISTHSKKSCRTVDNADNNMEHSHASQDKHLDSLKNWIDDFKPRDSTEIVRNCTQVNRKILDDIVGAIVKKLLQDTNFLCIFRANNEIKWNTGGKLKMGDLCSLLNEVQLQCLKNQRGGIQTLIRNHKEVFEVKKGDVQLRVPSAHRDDSKNRGVRRRSCFFHRRHPQGCPLAPDTCAFSHEDVPFERT